MHFIDIFTVTSLVFGFFAGASLAAPFEGQDSVHIVRRGGQVCKAANQGIFRRFDIWVPDDKKYNRVCGSGCLDNIRGRCGSSVTDWGCDMGKDGVAYYHFNTQSFCSDGDMEAAMKACTKQEFNAKCTSEDGIGMKIIKPVAQVAVGALTGGPAGALRGAVQAGIGAGIDAAKQKIKGKK
jgi:hypothetical protein